MDSDEECIHGLGPVSACVICNGTMQKERREQEKRRQEVQFGFYAKFQSVCPNCKDLIREGDKAFMDGDNRAICHGCGEQRGGSIMTMWGLK